MKEWNSTAHSELRSHLLKYAEDSNNDNIAAKKLQEMLSDYFQQMPSLNGIAHLDFVYAVNVVQQQLCYQQGIEASLGYKASAINLGWLVDILHPDERQTLVKFTRRMQDFVHTYGYDTEATPVFSLGHRIQNTDGNYIKILRRIQPWLVDDQRHIRIYVCLCTDITAHHAIDKITFDVALPPGIGITKEEALHYFADLFSGEPVQFTGRELDVIRVWSETDSAKLAAERLNITARTVETHLKNARKKLGVRRTLDVVLYAKEKGWL